MCVCLIISGADSVLVQLCVVVPFLPLSAFMVLRAARVLFFSCCSCARGLYIGYRGLLASSALTLRSALLRDVVVECMVDECLLCAR